MKPESQEIFKVFSDIRALMSMLDKRFTTNGKAEQKSVLAFKFLRAARQESMYACFSSDFNLRHCLTVNGVCLFVRGNKVYAVCH